MNLVHPGRPIRVETRNNGRVMQSRASGNIARLQRIPEYMDQPETQALITNTPHTDFELAMMLQWQGRPSNLRGMNYRSTGPTLLS